MSREGFFLFFLFLIKQKIAITHKGTTPRNTSPVTATTFAEVVKASKNPVVVVSGKDVVGGSSVDDTVTSGFVVMDVDDVVVVDSFVVSFDSIVSRQQLIANELLTA